MSRRYSDIKSDAPEVPRQPKQLTVMHSIGVEAGAAVRNAMEGVLASVPRDPTIDLMDAINERGVDMSPRTWLVSPVSDDALVPASLAGNWSAEQSAELEQLVAITPTKKAAVVVAMRDDGVSILEWIAHYRALGFEGIFIYSNDNNDGSDSCFTD